MALLNYTTEIEVEKTLNEIQKCLREHAANAVLTEYDDQGYITALSFKINLNGQSMGFRLPSDWRPVLAVMTEQGNIRTKRKYSQEQSEIDAINQKQAMRVSWRIVKDWVEAQMAIVETRMVTMPQVFLPYAVTKNGQTVYEKIAGGDEDSMKLLS